MTHFWFWKKWLPDRRGHPCRVLARGRLNSILIEFADGWKVVTSRYAVRRGVQTSALSQSLSSPPGP